jgi:thiol-disulfide isomerase/thioredoxin/limonene-1,2-epoxide hydrolase
MHKYFVITAGLGVAAALALATASDQSPKLRAYVQALAAAESVQSTLTVQKVGGASEEIKLALAKPDKARIETAATLTIADGETVTTYDKKDNTFFKRPQTQEGLMEIFDPVELMFWRPFFDAAALDKVGTSKDGGERNRGGKSLAAIEIAGSKGSGLSATLFVDKSDSSLQQAVLIVTGSGKTETKILTASGNQSAATDLFSFNAPAGAKELSEAELVGGVWMTDFEEAKSLAAKFNKTLIGDFYATWCGPCKMLFAEVFSTAEFKNAAKDFILVKIDIDKEPATAQKYNVESIPTVVFWTPKHQEVKRFVGFKPLDDVLGEMASAKNAR